MKRGFAGDKKARKLTVFVSACVLFFAAACDQFSLSDAFSDNSSAHSSSDLAINPASINLSRGTSQTFTASGGTPPYTFSVVSGDGFFDPPTVDVLSALYWAVTTNIAGGAATIRVQDSAGAGSLSSVVIGPLYVAVGISPIDPVVMVGTDTLTFTHSDGAPQYVFSVNTERGASIDPATGAYRASNTKGIDTVVVTDGLGETAASIVTVYAAPELVFSPSVVKLNSGSFYPFTYSGGAGGYVFTVSGGGTIDAAGVYAAPAGSGTDTVRVTDKVNVFQEATVEIVGAGAPLEIAPAAVMMPQGGQMRFTAVGGAPPYSFSALSTGPMPLEAPYTDITVYTASVLVGVNAETITLGDSVLTTAQTQVTVFPAAPSNLTATDMTGKVIRLTWQDNSNGEDSFKVQRKEEYTDDFVDLPVIVPANDLSYQDTGLTPNQLYIYRIRAVSATTRDSYYSNEASAVVTN